MSQQLYAGSCCRQLTGELIPSERVLLATSVMTGELIPSERVLLATSVMTGELIPSERVLLATSVMHNTPSLSNRRVDPI